MCGRLYIAMVCNLIYDISVINSMLQGHVNTFAWLHVILSTVSNHVYIKSIKINAFNLWFWFSCLNINTHLYSRHVVAQWVAYLTRNVEVMCSRPTKGSFCFPEQDTIVWTRGQIVLVLVWTICSAVVYTTYTLMYPWQSRRFCFVFNMSFYIWMIHILCYHFSVKYHSSIHWTK